GREPTAPPTGPVTGARPVATSLHASVICWLFCQAEAPSMQRRLGDCKTAASWAGPPPLEIASHAVAMPDGSPPACFTAAVSCEHSCFSASIACGGRLGGGKEGVPPPFDAWTPTLTCARMLTLPPWVLPPLPLAPTAPVAPAETPTVVVVVDDL